LTEIPEHLLQRSRERRAALGLGGGGEGGAGAESGATAGALPAGSTPSRTTTAPVTTATAAAPAAKGKAAAPAVIEEVHVLAPPPRPIGPHKLPIPIWVMPVLVALPLWAFFFPGAFTNHHPVVVTDPIAIGDTVYHSSCSTCHGTNGEGGVGPALHGGQAVLTFPNVADQIKWVQTGSMGLAKNQPYGNPNRPGGQHVASKDDMPAFANALTPTQIQDVVAYERTKL
jgi:mono/diheme cytochrome c family protein